jgi:hypothetical protein
LFAVSLPPPSAALSVEAVVAVSVEDAAEWSPPRDWASNCRRLSPEALDVSALGSVVAALAA